MKFLDRLLGSGRVNYVRETLKKTGMRAVVSSLPHLAKICKLTMVSSGDADSNNTDAESIEEGRENETLVVDEEGTKILDEQADCINSPEESDNSAENAEAKGNETTAENITTIDEPVYGMYLPEDAEIETTIDPDDSLYLRDDEIAFADDCEEETWEELWENDENIEEANDVLQENQQGEMEEKPLYTGARITLGVSLLLIITFAMRHQLSGIALTDLLTLIDIHLIAPNCFTRSMATLHKFFKQLKKSCAISLLLLILL